MNNRRDIFDIENANLPASRARKHLIEQEQAQAETNHKATRARKWVEFWTTLAKNAEKKVQDYLKRAQQFIDENSEIATPNLRRLVFAVAIIFILYPGVFAFDYSIAPDVVEYIGFTLGDEEGEIPFWKRLLAGGMILALEIGLSTVREAIGEQNRRLYKILGFLYLIFAGVMALLFRAAFAAGHAGFAPDVSSVLIREAVTIASFFAHAAVLLGGKPALEAKELMLYNRVRFLAQWNSFKFMRRIRRVFTSFQKYLDVKGGNLTPGDERRFSIDAKRYINEVAGEPVFTLPTEEHSGDGAIQTIT